MMVAKICHISEGNFANVVGWEDVTVYLSAAEGDGQAIQVALERDKEPYGKVLCWYQLHRVCVRDNYTDNVNFKNVVALQGTFRYVRVVGEGNKALAFSIAGKVPK